MLSAHNSPYWDACGLTSSSVVRPLWPVTEQRLNAELPLAVSRIISGLLCYPKHNTWPSSLRPWPYPGAVPRKGNRLSAQLLIISTLADCFVIFHPGGSRLSFLGTSEKPALNPSPVLGNSSLVWRVGIGKPWFISSWFLWNLLYLPWALSLLGLYILETENPEMGWILQEEFWRD